MREAARKNREPSLTLGSAYKDVPKGVEDIIKRDWDSIGQPRKWVF
jgi:hypothetical protein